MSNVPNHRATGLPQLGGELIAEVRLRRFCGEPLKSIERAMGRPVRYYAYGGKTRAERIAADPTYLTRHHASKRASRKRRYDPGIQRERYRLYYRARKLVRDHQEKLVRRGISQQEYDVLLDRQGGLCALCGGENNRKGRLLALDHDHRTDRIRGLLCSRCNLALGWFDDADFLRRAAAYLEA